jgi:large subunit ribosomal protein L10e
MPIQVYSPIWFLVFLFLFLLIVFDFSRFPGRQKIIVSKNWGFTPLRRQEYMVKRQNGEVKPDGAYVKFLRPHGPIAENVKQYPQAFAASA